MKTTRARYIKWVCIGIDHHGVVVGHVYRHGDDGSLAHHTDEEKQCGTTCRWSVKDQMFMGNFIPQVREFTDEEICLIENWLVKNGYRTD